MRRNGSTWGRILTAFAAVVFVRSAEGATPDRVYSRDGSIFIKDTLYEIPAGAWFVSPVGRDSAPGNARAPWKTLSKAVAAANPGSTIILRGGAYREGEIKTGGKALTIQPYPHESVWIKGSVVVSDWTKDGRTWRFEGWTPRIPHDSDPRAIDPAHPRAAWPEMVFVDGKPLRQAGDATSVGSGDFFVDEDRKRIVIGDDPAGKIVEVSAWRFALNAFVADGLTIRGLGFCHYATSATPEFKAALILTNTRAVVEDSTFAWNATSGLAVFGKKAEIRGNTFVFNGQVGVAGWRCDGSAIERNHISYNNVEHFKKDWDNGGLKITETRGLALRDNWVECNEGPGLWLDVSCRNVDIVGNVLNGNASIGVFYEISAKCVIVSNLFLNNEIGINAGAGSANVLIYNNTLIGDRESIRIVDDERASTAEPDMPWNTRDVELKNNVIAEVPGRSTRALQVLDFSKAPRTAEAMEVRVNSNVYRRADARSLAGLVWWSRGAKSSVYGTLREFLAETRQESNGVELDDRSPRLFIDEERGDYRISREFEAGFQAAELPEPVARALKLSPGVRPGPGATYWAGMPQGPRSR
ncbi:right-handed parallel beta-helix repeat-containing protein [Singulisphaera rosea]